MAHYCLEILNDLLKGFGMIMVRDLASIQSSILPLLSSEVAATRKRASVCVASLAICAPDQLFNTLSTPPLHPGGNPGTNLKSISHRCARISGAFVWELT